jgi:hypothetical protein
VITVANQPLVQLAGEQGDAIDARVVAEPVAGDAHLAATAGFQNLLVEVGPSVDRDLAGDGIVTQATRWNAGRGHSQRNAGVCLY